MLTVRILCVGKCKEKYWREACAEYGKRLSAFCRFEVLEVDEERLPERPSKAQIESGLEQEGKRLLQKAGSTPIVALCIEGKELESLPRRGRKHSDQPPLVEERHGSAGSLGLKCPCLASTTLTARRQPSWPVRWG